MDLPHRIFYTFTHPHGFSAQGSSAHFLHYKSCLNFNKIVFIETIGKTSRKKVRKKFKNMRKILVRKILCGKFLKKLCGAFVPIALNFYDVARETNYNTALANYLSSCYRFLTLKIAQSMPAQWEGVTLPNFVVTSQKLVTNFVFGTRKPVFSLISLKN
jgi:hypothetical protein